MYRFKTEQEFIKEFGEEWYSLVMCCWDTGEGYFSMNHFLGWEPTSKIDQEFIDTIYRRKTYDGYSFEPNYEMSLKGNPMRWKFSYQMFTKINGQMEFNF